MHPHAALPRGFAKKIKGEGRTQTDTLTVSSRISPRNKNTSKSARSHPMTAARHNRLIVKGAEHVKPLRGRLGALQRAPAAPVPASAATRLR